MGRSLPRSATIGYRYWDGSELCVGIKSLEPLQLKRSAAFLEKLTVHHAGSPVVPWNLVSLCDIFDSRAKIGFGRHFE